MPNSFLNLGYPGSRSGIVVYGRGEWESQFPPVEWSEAVDLEGIKCSEFPGHQRAGERIGDLDLVLPSPRIGDFSWTWVSDCIMTDRVLVLLRGAGLTGFDVRPVTVNSVKLVPKGSSVEIPALWELVVTGQGGDADPESGIRPIYECQGCGLREYSSYRNGIIVDESQWDGSDFFTVNGYPRLMLITERVAAVIIGHGLTNCQLIPSRELRWSELVIKPEDVSYE